MNGLFHCLRWEVYMVEVMEQRLAAKKRELERQQEYFRIDIKNMEIAAVLFLLFFNS